MKHLCGSFTQERCLSDSSVVSPVAGSEDPRWRIPGKGLYGGHGVLDHSGTVPSACSSAAWSHDVGVDSQQQLLMSTHETKGRVTQIPYWGALMQSSGSKVPVGASPLHHGCLGTVTGQCRNAVI